MSAKLSRQLAAVAMPLQHQVDRIDEELAFAAQLCGMHPAKAAIWRPLIARARQQMEHALAEGHLEAIPAAVAAAEETLEPLATVAKSYTIHCVGHAHIDMNWMWSWPETVAVSVDTLSTVLRLMEEYPAFTFSQSQASIYAILERYQPDMLLRIGERIKEGRWEVTASHWVEGDKNLASGESLCRHLLYTRAYVQRLFGLGPEEVPIDWAPDTFGHPATMPTYLVRGGVKYAYLHRPGIHTPAKHGAFWWEGPDGSRILTRNDMEQGYNGQFRPDMLAGFLLPKFEAFVALTGGHDHLFVYGVGDHGGGPTRRDIHYIMELATWPIFPAVTFSTACAFFRKLEQDGPRVPVIRGELNTEFTGCYTSQSLIKKANRFAENRLVDAELAAVVARMTTGQPYAKADFEEAWRDTLFSQFHDILPGSCVHDTRTYAHGLFQKTMATTSQVELRALRGVASRVDTAVTGSDDHLIRPPAKVTSALGAGVGFKSADGALTASEQTAGQGPRPFVLFNPTAFDREEIVEATVWDSALHGDPPLKNRVFSVCQPGGAVITPQRISEGHYNGHFYLTLAFPAKVAGLGYARYIIQEAEAEVPDPLARQTGLVHHCAYMPVERSREGLENEILRMEVDPVSGGIATLVDKRAGRMVIAPTAPAVLEYAVERPHPATAWCIDQTGPVKIPELTTVRRGLTGPYKASIEVDLRIQESTFTVTYELHAGDPKLYVHIKGAWFQRGTRESGVPQLRLAVPLALDKALGRYEIPFGAIDRTLNDGDEVPALQWAQVTGLSKGEVAGCLLLNDSKHGHSLTGSTLRMTLIRSSYEPDLLPEIGQHETHVALLPFEGDLPVSEAIHAGSAFNHAIRVIGTDVHSGQLPAAGQFIRVTPASVVTMAVKQAEDGEGVVVRLLNPTEKSVVAKIHLDTSLFGPVKSAIEVDLMERPLPRSGVTVSAAGVRAPIAARGMATILVKVNL